MTATVEQTAVSADLTDLERKIIRQVEYYFGDMNLARDKFLREEIAKDDGWVSLETMLNFNRLKQLTGDAEVIAAALKKSALMEVSEDVKKIRRSPAKPLCEVSRDDLKSRCIYAKGFPLDITLDQAMEFFEKFGRTDSIHMRKDAKKQFKGSCFVTYSNDSSAKSFVETEDVKYNDVALVRYSRDDYFKTKIAQRKQKTEEKSKKSEEQQQAKEKDEIEKVKARMTTGAILSIEGIPARTRREDIKSYFSKYGLVEWIDFESGNNTSRVRFGAKADAAKDALEKAKEENEGKIIINDVELQCRVLEGDEEVEHWEGIFKSKRERQMSSKDKFKKKRRGGDRRGGPQRKRGRKPSEKDSSADKKDKNADGDDADGDDDDDDGDDNDDDE